MVKNFRGQVKVSDIKEEFDSLVNGLNNIINTYNQAIQTTETVDYTKGSTEIAPVGYTLTVGALKKILNAYNGCLLGGQVYKISDGIFNVTKGLYVTSDRIYKLEQGLLSGSGDILYYDLTNNAYTFGDKFISGGEGSTQIIEKPFVLPTMTSNTSWGTIGGGFQGTGDALFGNTRKGMYAILNGEYATIGPYTQSAGESKTYSVFEWTFQEPLTLTELSVDWKNQGINAIKISSLDGQVLAMATTPATIANRTVKASLSGDTQYNGIKIEIVVPNQSGFVMLGLGNLKINAKSSQIIEIPAGSEQPVDKNNLIKVADLNINRITPLCNTPNFIAEEIPNFKIGSTTTDVYIPYNGVTQTLDTSEKGKFLSFSENYNNNATLFGVEISNNHGYGNSSSSWYMPVNRLFIPKGISNPYSASGRVQLVFDTIITRQTFTQT